MTYLKNDYSFQQDRIGVIYDYIGKTFLERHLRELYRNDDQYVYLNVSDSKEFNAEMLFSLLNKKITNGELINPNETEYGKVVYCHYLKLSDLTTEWVDNFFSQSKEMLDIVGYNNLSDQYHLICFRVRAREIPKDKVDQYVRLLLRLGTEYSSEISRQIYIIREQGLINNQIRKQEYGIAQLFYMCSRKGHVLLQPVKTQSGTGIQIVRYADYYENQQKECQERLDKVLHWMDEEEDQGQVRLINDLRSVCIPLIEDLRSAELRLSEDISIHPVRITEYSGNCLLGYSRDEANVRRRFSAFREEALRKKAFEIVDNADFTSVYNLLDSYCQKDLISLREGIASEKIKEALLNDEDVMKNGKGRQIVEAVYEKFLQEISDRIEQENLEEQLEEKLIEKRQVTVLLNEAGLFSNLGNCFQRINAVTQLGAIQGKLLKNQFSACLVNGPYIDNWDINGTDIAGVTTAFGFQNIHPLQVAMLREYNYLSFDGVEDKEQIVNDLNHLF